MTNIFKQEWTKEDMVAADNAREFPAVVQDPHETPDEHVPSQYEKRKWPAPVVSVTRPRFGKGGY